MDERSTSGAQPVIRLVTHPPIIWKFKMFKIEHLHSIGEKESDSAITSDHV